MEEGGLRSGHTPSIVRPPPQERAADRKPPGVIETYEWERDHERGAVKIEKAKRKAQGRK